MEIARIEDSFLLKGHLVLGAVLLPGAPQDPAEVRAALGQSLTIRTPEGEEFTAPLLDLDVRQALGGQMQLMAGIDPMPGRPTVPVGSLIISRG